MESHIDDPSKKIAGILGINKTGDLQHIFMLTIVPKAIGNASAVLGNFMDASSEPAFVYLDISDLGYTSVIETYALIPREILPEEPLPAKFLKGTVWEAAKVPLGLACILVAVPIFFGMPVVETNIHDSDFEEKLAQLSPTHLAWAKLVKENITQQENDGQDYKKILSRISKGDENTVSKYISTPNTSGVELLEAPIIQVFSLPKNKWNDAQEKLRSFFKCNPSPTRQLRPSSTSPVSSPIGVTFATNIRATTPVIVPTNATASQQMTANNQQPFDPGL